MILPKEYRPLIPFLTPILCFLYFLVHYRSPAYFAGGVLVLAGYAITLSVWEKIRTGPWGMIALGLLCIGLPAAGLLQFLQWGDIGDLDHAFYANALWNFRHGHLDYAYENINVLGIHAQYLAAAVWIPAQAMFGEIGLKLGQAACLITASILAFRHLGPVKSASWGMTALLLSPPIASQFFFGFHIEFFGAPFLILAMAAYRESKLGWFLALTAGLSYCKEVYTLAIAGILIIALLEKRNWKWILYPALLCCAQMAVYWYIIVPSYAPRGNFLKALFPVSLSEATGMWARPETLLFALLVTFPFLPLLARLPKRYLWLPVPLLLFYASFSDSIFRVVWQHYTFLFALLCAGGIVMQKDATPDGGRFSHKILFACATVSLLAYPAWRQILKTPVGSMARIEAVRELQARVPDQASLLINAGFTARFSAREKVMIWGERSLWGKRSAPIEDFEYVLLDGRFKPEWLTDPDDLTAGLAKLSASPDWSTEYAQDSVFLFHRQEKTSFRQSTGLP